MIIPLNREIVSREVIEWARRKIAGILGCPLSKVKIEIEMVEGKTKLTFHAPGLASQTRRESVQKVAQAMDRMRAQRLATLDTRRVRDNEGTTKN
jgi:hypothetical protein